MEFLAGKLLSRSVISQPQVTFITDLYLYGFSFPSEQFVNDIFPIFRHHLLDLLPKYVDILTSNEFFSPRNQKLFTEAL